MKLKLIFPDLGHFPLVYRRYIPVLGPAILAGLTPPEVEVSFTDERVSTVDIREDCDLVAVSVMTPQAGRAYELSRLYREKGIPVILGGVHVSLLPEEAQRHADAIVIGEAEEIWPKVLEDFSRGTLQKVYRCQTPPQTVTLPRWELFPRDSYIPMNSVQVARGCPVNCDLCSVPLTFGREFRLFNLELLLENLAELDHYLFLVNDNLHLAKRRIRPLFEGMAGLGKPWVGLASLPFAKDEDYLRLLKKSHCWAMYVDLSPWVSAGLNEVIGGVEVRRAGEYLKRVRDQGIKVIASFVFGFDHDKKDVFEKTVAFAKAHQIEEAEFHILTPYPRSRLYARLESEGRLFNKDFSDYTAGVVVYEPRHMTPDELYAGYLQSWRDFYDQREIRETDGGPVVLSYDGFPISLEEIYRTRGRAWLDRLIETRFVKQT